jgi:hypothetical protein
LISYWSAPICIDLFLIPSNLHWSFFDLFQSTSISLWSAQMNVNFVRFAPKSLRFEKICSLDLFQSTLFHLDLTQISLEKIALIRVGNIGRLNFVTPPCVSATGTSFLSTFDFFSNPNLHRWYSMSKKSEHCWLSMLLESLWMSRDECAFTHEEYLQNLKRMCSVQRHLVW